MERIRLAPIVALAELVAKLGMDHNMVRMHVRLYEHDEKFMRHVSDKYPKLKVHVLDRAG